MEAWLLDESPGAYRYGEVDLPGPGPGEVWVRLVTSALNHLDLWMRKAMPKLPMFPMVPGCDGAGTVAAVGEGVPAGSWATRSLSTRRSRAVGACSA